MDATPTPGELYDFDLELHPYGILDYEPWDEDEATRGESLLDESDPKVNFLCLAKFRPGVNKVKPKGWFKYSLQID